MDENEVVMMIRAILASKKDPINLHELKREYIEANGIDIPYRSLGFSNVVKFLESIPDKVNVKTDISGVVLVSPVIDKQMMELSQLVKGQRRAKKSKGKKSTGRPFSGSFNSRFNRNTRKPMFDSYSTNNYNSNNNNNISRNYNYTANRTSQKPVFNNLPPRSAQSQNSTSYNSVSFNYLQIQANKAQTIQSSAKFTPMQRTVFLEQNIQPITRVVEQKKIDEVVKIDELSSNWIENAAYFLRDHEIEVLNFLSVDEITLRLKNCELSRQYEKLKENMRAFYTSSNKSCSNIVENQVCVAKNYNAYYRVQIIEISNYKAHCCFVDEGYNGDVSVDDIYPINREFLDLKFQTIISLLQDFDEFNQNQFIKYSLERMLCTHSYTAKRTEAKPLKIKLFVVGTNECVNEHLLIHYSHFKKPKLAPNSEFYGFVSFFDDRKKLTHVQLDDENRNKYLEEMIVNLTEHFNKSNGQKLVNINNIEKDQVFCAKFSKDNYWYRVRVTRASLTTDGKILVDFVDYGNEENIPFHSLREMPDEFMEYKYLPFQAIGVIVTEISNSKLTILDLLEKDTPNLIKINSINNNRIPYVTIFVNNDSKSNTDCESTEFEDEEPNLKSESNSDSDTVLEATVCETDNNNNNTFNGEDKCIEKDDHVDGLIKRFSLLSNINFGIMEKVHCNELAKSNLPPASYVYVTCASDPSSFTISLQEEHQKYTELINNMEEFYINKNMNKVSESNLIKEHIYVLKSENVKTTFSRVKFLGYIRPGMAKLFNIDDGTFDLSPVDDIYYISKKFTILPMLALDASLAFVQYDLKGKWSEKTSKHFCSLVNNKLLRTHLVRYHITTDRYLIDLFDKNVSISKLLLDGNYATKD